MDPVFAPLQWGLTRETEEIKLPGPQSTEVL
jgi:hypothetical protein